METGNTVTPAAAIEISGQGEPFPNGEWFPTLRPGLRGVVVDVDAGPRKEQVGVEWDGYGLLYHSPDEITQVEGA